jgi:hypothetical protein
MSAEYMIQDFEFEQRERTMLDKVLRECAEFAAPEKADFIASLPGDSRPRHIIIDHVAEANRYFARGMQSNLMPTNLQWFRFNAKDPEKAESNAAKEYFSENNRRLYLALMNSNFMMEMYEAFEDAGWCGTPTVTIEEDDEKIFRFTNYHISEFWVKEDHEKKLTTHYRLLSLTAENIIEKFNLKDDQLDKEILEFATSDKPDRRNQKFDIIHVVKKRKNREYNKATGKAYEDPKNLPWAEFYIDRKHKSIIRESGYYENPFNTGRVEKKSRQKYGHSPAMSILRTAKQLNKVWFTTLKAAEKRVDPVTMLNASAYTKGLSPQFKQNPGNVNLYDGTQPNSAPQFQQIPADVGVGLEIYRELANRIDNAFFVDMFTMISKLNETQGRQRTAFEIQQLVAEKHNMIIPLVGRLLEELITSILQKAWAIMERRGHFVEMPEELSEADVEITYISPLALATRMVDVNVFFDFLNTIAPLAEIDPERVAARIDVDKAITTIADRMGVDTNFTRTQEEADELQAQRAQQQQAMMEQQQLTDLARSQDLMKKPEEGSIATSAMEQLINAG